jgi:AcrR family transcriptional regulator
MLPRRPLGRPKSEHLGALEERLVLVARETFARNGYGATSINEIARAARVSKNTLYARFPSKVALFQAIVARQIASVDQLARPRPTRQARTLAGQLRAYANAALNISSSPDVLQINRLIFSESYQFKELREAAEARFQVGIDHVAALIKDFAARDDIACRDPSAAAEMFLLSLHGWYMFLIIKNGAARAPERERWVNKVLRIFMAGRSAW